MKAGLKEFLPQWAINYFWHLPKAVYANFKYGFPSKNLTIVGVTGTDGKTTTVNMIYQIIKNAGEKVSMVSTINAVAGGKRIDTGFHVTSPDPMLVQKLLRQSADDGDEFAVLEVTSHALDQFRFWGINFKVGVITNITHEHLDYHKTRENYFSSKAKLIKNANLSVLNRDEEHYEKLARISKNKLVSFGLTRHADFNPKNFPLKLKIPGKFNILNGLAASAVTTSLGIDPKIVKKTLAVFNPLPGRMEEVKNNLGIKIIIDFAHTPNGIKQALKTLRAATKGKLIALIGAEGLRDEGKRPMMGRIGKELADIVIITAVDPRGFLDKINSQIMEGVEDAGGKLGKDVFIKNDRQEAIEFAINKIAKRGDCVSIFGKGHEKSMNIDGKHEIPWSDKEAAKRALR